MMTTTTIMKIIMIKMIMIKQTIIPMMNQKIFAPIRQIGQTGQVKKTAVKQT